MLLHPARVPCARTLHVLNLVRSRGYAGSTHPQNYFLEHQLVFRRAKCQPLPAYSRSYRTTPPTTPDPAAATIAKEAKLDTNLASPAVSDKEQRLTDWSIIKRLAVNIWPKGETAIKVRVVTAISLLIAGKVSFVIATMDD